MKTILIGFCLSIAVCVNAQNKYYTPAPKQDLSYRAAALNGQRDANISWAQLQQIVIAAQKSAAQAADYAKQAAPYNNEAAKQAASYATHAAFYADRATELAAHRLHIFNDQPTTLEDAAAYAKQAAANAKEAAAKAEIDSAVSNLENERDQAVAELKAKFAPSIAELKSKVSELKAKAAQLESQRSQSERENAHLRAKQLFQPKDPWRSLDGKIYNAKDESWVHFTGKVLEVRLNGILLHGDFGPPLEAGFGERDFYVDNFPVQTYPMADGETITSPENFVAHLGEKSSIYQFTNTTIDLRVNTVRRLDYRI